MAELKRINDYHDGRFYNSNLYVDAVVIYSLRKLRYDYTGPSIRVRRDSDNSEQDIYFDGWGRLDEVSLLSFVGTGGSNNGFVSKFYEQVSGTIEAVQTAAAYQPQIVDSGSVIKKNGRPHFYVNNSFMASSFTTTYNQPNTIFGVGQTSGGVQGITIDGDNTSPSSRNIINFNGGTGQYNIYAGTHLYGSNVVENKEHVYTGIFNGVNSKIYIDGSLDATGDVGSQNFQPIKLFGFFDSTANMRGHFAEVVIYNSNKDSSNRSDIEKDILKYYKI
jgi:hypothetical protein